MIYTLKKWIFRGILKLWSGPWFPNVYTMIHSVYLPRALYVVGALRIPDLLQEQPRTIDELVELTETHKRSLYRIMRLLAAYDVFTERADGTFALARLGKTLVSDHPESALWWTLSLGDELWRSNSRVLDSVKTGETGFKLEHGVGVWEWYPQHAREHDIFIKGMNGFTIPHCREIVRAYNFGKFKQVVDVGGGGGVLMCQILDKNPQTRGIVFDQPRTIEETKERIAERNLTHRCEAIGGNFFKELPPGADAYILKHVLRDWDDESVVKILSRIREAIPEDGLLLIVDAIVNPKNNTDRMLKLIDTQMMVDAGGGLRTREEFEELLGRAGFAIQRVQSTMIIDGSILEVRPVPVPAKQGGQSRTATSSPAAVPNNEPVTVEA